MTAPRFLPGVLTVTIVRAPLAAGNRYGASARRDWTNATRTDSYGWFVQPLSASENDVDREYAASHVRFFGPAGANIESTDRLEFDGDTYEVDGEPARWRDDDGQIHHLQVDVKRVTG